MKISSFLHDFVYFKINETKIQIEMFDDWDLDDDDAVLACLLSILQVESKSSVLKIGGVRTRLTVSSGSSRISDDLTIIEVNMHLEWGIVS